MAFREKILEYLHRNFNRKEDFYIVSFLSFPDIVSA